MLIELRLINLLIFCLEAGEENVKESLRLLLVHGRLIGSNLRPERNPKPLAIHLRSCPSQFLLPVLSKIRF